MSRIAAAFVVLAAAVLWPGAAAAVAPLTVTAVKDRPPPVNEESPSAAPGEFAWVQNTRSHPHLYNVYAQNGRGARFRVNPAGTQGGLGAGIDGHTLVYTQLHGTKSSIRMFNLQTRRGVAPPAGVNTPAVEDEPSISGGWLLFHRLQRHAAPGRASEQVLLRNLTTGATRTLATVKCCAGFLEAGQVNGDWAVWTQSVNGTRFNVWRYQISTRTTTLVPNPASKVHSAAAVNPNGTVYFEQSGPACGSAVTVEIFPVGGPVTAAGTLPAGIDLFHPFLYQHSPTDDFLFARIHCSGGAADVYRAPFA
jgi:hypothetical protein